MKAFGDVSREYRFKEVAWGKPRELLGKGQHHNGIHALLGEHVDAVAIGKQLA